MIKNKVVLFEIPIYKTSEKKHNEKWHTILAKNAQLCRNTDEEQKKFISEMMSYKYPTNIWEYNQIIGYIKIYLWHNDMHFGLYLCNKNKFNFNSCKKDFIEDMTPSGSHFYIDSSFSNQNIIDCMSEQLNSIIKYEIKKTWFVDLKIYNLLHKELDYLKIIQEHQK